MTQSRSTPIRGQSNRETQPDPLDVVADTHRDRNEDQPLSIAEELAGQGIGQGSDGLEQYGDFKEGEVYLTELQKMSMSELIEAGREGNIADGAAMKRQELIFNILKERVKTNGMMFGEGTLEILPDGFGFLRSADYHYLSCPDDIYVSPSQIRRFGLQTGNTVSGQIRPPKESERYFALLRVEAVNYEDPNLRMNRVQFDELTPLHPDKRIMMESDATEISTRVVDLVTPIGFGQ
ncbi:MAG: transcription termination factor Rho, partial [Planctomycetaceae bacterium]|nr:transcription termination factor Rho [Planctomycetaceae bacterium]